MSNDQGRLISGDSYRDNFNLRNPEHLIRAVDEVMAGGVTLSKAALEVRDRELEEERCKAQRAEVEDEVHEALQRVRADKAAAAAQALRDRTVTLPSEPTSESDWLVIGEGLDRYPGGEETQQEIDGKIYCFYPHAMIHFVPEEVANSWPHRRGLPGQTVGGNLLRAFRQDFTRLKAGGRQGTGPGYSEIEVDEDGLIAACSRVVRACRYRPLLERWLASAQAGGDGPSQVLAKVIEERLRKLGNSAEAAA